MIWKFSAPRRTEPHSKASAGICLLPMESLSVLQEMPYRSLLIEISLSKCEFMF